MSKLLKAYILIESEEFEGIRQVDISRSDIERFLIGYQLKNDGILPVVEQKLIIFREYENTQSKKINQKESYPNSRLYNSKRKERVPQDRDSGTRRGKEDE